MLDELTTGLDPEARRETWALIERMRESGVTVILVTHFMDEAEARRGNLDEAFIRLTRDTASAASEQAQT